MGFNGRFVFFLQHIVATSRLAQAWAPCEGEVRAVPGYTVALTWSDVLTVLAMEAEMPDRARRIAAHELGHVLGLTQHSANQLDLMWRTDPTAERRSVRDVATVQVRYHLRPDIVP